MEDHIRPAAVRAGIQRISWHALRHTFGTLVKSQGADVATTQALLRHANVSITMDRYVQAVTPAKREAQSRIIDSISFPEKTRESTQKETSESTWEQNSFPSVPTGLTIGVANA
jgi:hypothetical protein